MKKMITIGIIAILFAVPALSCEDYFCKSLQTMVGIDLTIGQSYGAWSNKDFNKVRNYSMGYQDINASGYTGNDGSALFNAEAAQGYTFDDSYLVGNTSVSFTGFSFMESLASGEATPNCDLSFYSSAGQNTTSNVDVYGSMGLGSSLDMSSRTSVYGLGTDLSFNGTYEQSSTTFTQNSTGFTFTKGFTGAYINK